MTPGGPTTSGDAIADRRYDYAQGLRQRGDLAAAADILRQTLERQPGWGAAMLMLGEVLGELGQVDEAIAVFTTMLANDSADRLGARPRLAVLRRQTPDTLPREHVRALFDQYADRFEESLTGRLAYRVPSLLREAVARHYPGHVFDGLIDLGCGTGLAARAFAGCYAHADGIDLSPEMIARARKTGFYRRLVTGDIAASLGAPGACGLAGQYDIALAADVLVYVGLLDDVFIALHRCLAPGAVTAFSVQTHDGEGMVLGRDYRFAHAPRYLTEVAARCGFEVRDCTLAILRRDAGEDVAGLICLWERSSR